MHIKDSPDNPPMVVSELLALLDDVTEERDGWVAHCPNHKDRDPSLRITVSEASGKVLLHDRAGCSNTAVMKALGLTMKDLAAMTADIAPDKLAGLDADPEPSDLADMAVRLDGYAATLFTDAGDDALAYAAQRFGVEPDTARRLGLGLATDLGGGPRLVVPFRDTKGRPRGFQARALSNKAQIRWAGPQNPDGAAWAKLGWFPGGSGWPEVVITEGPGDALTASATGYDAIGVRGAGLVSNEQTLDLLAEWLQDRVAVVAGDGDPAGQEFSTKLTVALSERGIAVKMLPVPQGKDLTDMRAEAPTLFKQGFVELVAKATTTTVTQALDAEWDTSIYALSDVGAARRLRDWLDGRGAPIRYTAALGFLQYRSGVWEQLGNEQVRTLAHEVGDFLIRKAKRMYGQAEELGSDKLKKAADAVMSYASRAQLSVGVDSIVKELKSVQGVYIKVGDFDRHPYLLAVRNGVIDLRTAQLQQHDPTLMLTRRIEYDYEPDSRAPRWNQFLSEVFPDQPDMPAYLQRLIGYGITGSTDEQCFVVNYGTGSNGKSLFTDTLTDVFRSITTTTPFSTFELKPSGGIPNDLAALNGARLVMASEGEQNKQMAEAVLKRITGRDMVSARFLNREFFEFRPKFLLFMSSNYRPAFKGQDDGLWRRVKLLEWRRQFKRSERDQALPQKLMAEAPGILAWAVAGAKLWYESGLEEPASVTEVTDSYRIQSDVLTGFVPGVWVHGDDKDWVKGKDLYDSFLDYAESENFGDLAKWSSRAFYRALEERNIPRGRRSGVEGFRKIRRGTDADLPHDDVPEEDGTIATSVGTGALTAPSLEGI